MQETVRVKVLHRDEALVVVDKPSGLSVHRGDDPGPVFALQLVRDLVGRYVYPIHRLDRATSGVLAFALSSEHASAVQAAFVSGAVDKTYLALVKGTPPESLVIDEPMKNDGGDEPVPAVTEVTRLFVTEHGFSLVLARPRTGRRHQIRRHLKRRHHKVAGDVAYGEGPVNRRLRADFGLHRLALHALELSLPHPVTGETLRVRAKVPADLGEPLARMGIPAALLT
jgi:tRNA pseudouridine65 synthase